jgi:hypothetical protein
MDSLYSVSVFDYTVQTFNSGRFQIWIFEIFHVKGLILKKIFSNIKKNLIYAKAAQALRYFPNSHLSTLYEHVWKIYKIQIQKVKRTWPIQGPTWMWSKITEDVVYIIEEVAYCICKKTRPLVHLYLKLDFETSCWRFP